MSDEQDDRITYLRAENERLGAEVAELRETLMDLRNHLQATEDYQRDPSDQHYLKLLKLNLRIAAKYRLEPGATYE